MHSSLSELEKNFQTDSTFKRNSRYYAAKEQINQERQDSIRRRRPITNADDSTKMNSSFYNSTVALTDKLSQDTHRFKKRVSMLELSPQKSEYEKEYLPPNSPKLRTFYIQKMTSRTYKDSLGNKTADDERLFNNFKIQKADLSQTCDFGKLKGRNLQLAHKHFNDLYHESKKAHEYCFYKDNTLKTKVSYSLENKNKKRYFFRSKRPEDFPATVLNPEKVFNGHVVASNFKGSNIRIDNIVPFYPQSGREMPCHLDQRRMNQMTNHYKGNNGKIVKPELDYTIRKMREDLVTKRRESILKSKKPQFTREEICDQRYFKINIAD